MNNIFSDIAKTAQSASNRIYTPTNNNYMCKAEGDEDSYTIKPTKRSTREKSQSSHHPLTTKAPENLFKIPLEEALKNHSSRQRLSTSTSNILKRKVSPKVISTRSKSKVVKSHKITKSSNQHKDHLQSKIIGLQKSIDLQERTLQELQVQLKSEKSELSFISEQLSNKKYQKRGPAVRSTQQNSSAVKAEKSFEQKYISENNDGRSSVDNGQGTILVTEDLASDFLQNQQTFKPTPLYNERLREIGNMGDIEEYKKSWLHMQAHTRLLEQSSSKQIRELQAQVEKLSEENFKLRYRYGIRGGVGTDDILNRLEEVYKAKSSQAKSMYEQRTQELVDREKDLKMELEEVNTRMAKISTEVKRNQFLEDKLDDLKKQLSSRENDVQLIKKYYTGKLQMKTEEQTKQKEEWSNVYKELLVEIRGLKTEIDQLCYENKKLSLSINSVNLAQSLRAKIP